MRLLVVAAALVALPALAQPTWAVLPASPVHSYRFEDAAFVTPRHGWVVNGSGETWETLDGGGSWARRSTVGEFLRTTAFVGERHGWIGALYGPRALFETTDGGATLVDATARIAPGLGSGNGLCGLFAIDAQTVVAVGQWSGPAYVAKTVDGGTTWQSQTLAGLAGSLVDVHFHDAQHGIAVGGTNATSSGSRAVVLGTDDGGATWTRRFVSSGAGTQAEWGWKITFPTPLVGYVSVEYNGSTPTGKVLKTEDGGLTWAELAVPGGGSMQGIGFWSADVGWTSGRGTVMRTVDGGATWAPSTELDGQVNRFEFFGDSLGFAMGQHVFALQRTTVASAPAPTPALALGLEPNPTAGAVTVHVTVPGGPVRLDVLDALGRRVATLTDGTLAAGGHAVSWEPSRAAPGVYVVRLVAGGTVATQRLTLVPR